MDQALSVTDLLIIIGQKEAQIMWLDRELGKLKQLVAQQEKELNDLRGSQDKA